MTYPIEKAENRTLKGLKITWVLWALAVALGIALAWWYQRGVSTHLADASHLKVPCVSYAPFRRAGANPAGLGGDISPAHIEEDLRLVKTLSACIRTYGVGKGLEAVPEIATKLGLRLRLGVWLGRDIQANQIEMDTALALTRRYPQTIDLLIIGNEVLLRQDLSPEALTAHLKDAKARSAVPVSYADVWEFWRRHAGLKQFVDVITVHVLPYWEDEPVPANLAASHVFDTVHLMQKEFSGQPVWLGETGWPAAGRQRAGAQPGVVEQTQVLRDVMLRAAQEGLDVNLIEAFDQPWKRNLEGGMGGAWGLFRADGSQRMTFQGPMSEDSLWWRGPLAALLTGLAALVLLVSRPHRATSFGWVLALALAGAVAPAHFDAMALWSRDRDEWGIAIAATLTVTTGAFALLWNLFKPQKRHAALSKFLSFALLVTSSVWAWYLWVDPRYRGFPIALFYCPAVYSLCLMIERGTISRYHTGLKQPIMTMPALSWTSLHTLAVSAIAVCLVFFSVNIMLAEGIKNAQALIMGLLWILIALGQIVACYPRHPVKA